MKPLLILLAGLCREHDLRLAIAESCTGGALSASIVSQAGASDYFASSVVSYSDEAKVKLLGVRPTTLSEHSAVSAEVAKEMAEGVSRLFDCPFALSTTGYLGPSASSRPVGTVFVGIHLKGTSLAHELKISAPREEASALVVRIALQLAVQHLQNAQEYLA